MIQLKRCTENSSVLLLLWKSNSKGACVYHFVAKMPFWKRIVRFWLQSFILTYKWDVYLYVLCHIWLVCRVLTQWVKFRNKFVSNRKKISFLKRFNYISTKAEMPILFLSSNRNDSRTIRNGGCQSSCAVWGGTTLKRNSSVVYVWLSAPGPVLLICKPPAPLHRTNVLWEDIFLQWH